MASVSLAWPWEYRHEIETALVRCRYRRLAPGVWSWLPQLHRGGRAGASSHTGDCLQPPGAESYHLSFRCGFNGGRSRINGVWLGTNSVRRVAVQRTVKVSRDRQFGFPRFNVIARG